MSKALLVLRHGQAENYADSGLDCDRCLTDFGRFQVESAVAYMQAQGQQPELILVSPYLRTQQTAAYAQAVFPTAACATWDALTPESDLMLLTEKLQLLTQENVLLVSHQPLVGALLSHLCGQSYGRYPMDTASLACLQSDLWVAGLAELNWLRHA
tara:strand:+ start:588 stop:1055 length:468 start_codon:yes stop_codon:yes gene_type:complete